MCTRDDETILNDFLMTVKDELYLPDREAVTSMSELVFTNGGFVGAFQQEKLCGTMGFFYGEPDQAFRNTEVVFLYVAAIADEFRLSRVFHKGLLFALREFEQMDKREIRLQAEAANPYTNKLYGRFASFLYTSKTLRGISVNTYGDSIGNALNCLDRRRYRRARQSKAIAA
jgi:hypothetical protein